MGKVDNMLYPMYQVMFAMPLADVSRVCSTGLHCLIRHGVQRMVTLADVVAPKASRRIIYNLHVPVVYLTYQVI